jgi:hypothetical protein
MLYIIKKLTINFKKKILEEKYLLLHFTYKDNFININYLDREYISLRKLVEL